MKKLILLFICLVLFGCSPIDKYNKKMTKLNEFSAGLDISMPPVQKQIEYMFEMRKEFPEYSGSIDGLIEALYLIQRKEHLGLDTYLERKNFTDSYDNLWEQIRANVKDHQQQHIMGLQMMGDTFKNLENQSQKYYEFQRDLNRDFKLNSPTHCTTTFIGSTAYTNCY